MEVRHHRPGISPDIPKELRSDLLGKRGSIGAVLVVIASTSPRLDIPKQKRSATFSRDTPRLELQKSDFRRL